MADCETSIVLLHAVPDMGLWQTVKRASCCYMLSQTWVCGRLCETICMQPWTCSVDGRPRNNLHAALNMFVADSVKQSACSPGHVMFVADSVKQFTCSPGHVLLMVDSVKQSACSPKHVMFVADSMQQSACSPGHVVFVADCETISVHAALNMVC